MAPPATLTDGAAAVARVRAVRAAQVISPAEEAQEIAAIEETVRRAPRQQARAVVRPGVEARAATDPGGSQYQGGGGAGGQAVHLASFKSEANARRAWTDLQARFPDLRGLSMTLSHVNLGAKGTFYRLMAGPLGGSQAAGLCQKLKARGHQYCVPTTQ